MRVAVSTSLLVLMVGVSTALGDVAMPQSAPLPKPSPLPVPQPLPTPTPVPNPPVVPPTTTPPDNNDNGHHHHPDTQPVYPYFNYPYPSSPNVGMGFSDSDDSSSAAQAPAALPDATTPPSAAPPLDMTNLAAQTENAINSAPEMVAANQAVQKAQAILALAKASVLDQLKPNRDYQDALKKRAAAEGILNEARDAHDPAAIITAAQSKLLAADEVTKLEEKAISTDPTAAAAKKQLEAAVAAHDAIRSNLLKQYTDATITN